MSIFILIHPVDAPSDGTYQDYVHLAEATAD